MHMRITGVHTYAGGFLHGLDAGDVVADYESWTPGASMAAASGLPVVEFGGHVERADMVVANPPCSRYSSAAVASYKKKPGMQADLATFGELQDVVDVTAAAGARTLWWETGPLLWSQGQEMVKAVEAALGWDRVTTLVLKLDLRYVGIPQRRPRCHVIHMRGDALPPAIPRARVPPQPSTLGTWVTEAVRNRQLEYPSRQAPDREGRDWVEWAWKHRGMKWASAKPYVTSEDDHYALALLTRTSVWLERNRPWDILEQAAIMGYPFEAVLAAIDSGRHSVFEVQSLMSKSVSPDASRWVYRNVIQPWGSKGQAPRRPKYKGGIWWVKATVGGSRVPAHKKQIVGDGYEWAR